MNQYESELFEILNNALVSRYGGVSDAEIYPILSIRHKLLPFSDNELSLPDFLLSELNLSERCRYKNVPINEGFVVQHFLDNIAFRASLKYEKQDILQIQEIVEKTAKSRAKKFKSLPEYPFFLGTYLIDELKFYFNTDFFPPRFLDTIVYEDDNLIFRRTIEERLDSYIHAVRLHTSHVAFVSELKVEDYLSRHLHLIEEGMTLVERQVIVPDGRIDILAKDKSGNFVIVEVKIEEDKDILWQCMYYPSALNEVRNTGKVRIITMCPEYNRHILEPLSKIENVEPFKYTLISECGEITDMSARKVPFAVEEKVERR